MFQILKLKENSSFRDCFEDFSPYYSILVKIRFNYGSIIYYTKSYIGPTGGGGGGASGGQQSFKKVSRIILMAYVLCRQKLLRILHVITVRSYLITLTN